MTRHQHTPELAAAMQLCFALADTATPKGRNVLIRLLHHLTGLPVAYLDRQWRLTR